MITSTLMLGGNVSRREYREQMDLVNTQRKLVEDSIFDSNFKVD
jgi:hypothetical protein